MCTIGNNPGPGLKTTGLDYRHEECLGYVLWFDEQDGHIVRAWREGKVAASTPLFSLGYKGWQLLQSNSSSEGQGGPVIPEKIIL